MSQPSNAVSGLWMLTILHPHSPPWSIFVNIYSLFEIQNVINLNICHEPGD